ncbi:MAG: hypothetical protein ACJ72M_03705 [Propionibacteriaceae bacterium]|jgi:hypothetical protein
MTRTAAWVRGHQTGWTVERQMVYRRISSPVPALLGWTGPSDPTFACRAARIAAAHRGAECDNGHADPYPHLRAQQRIV